MDRGVGEGQCQQGRYTPIDGMTVLMTHLTEVLRRESATLLTRAETDRLLERVRKSQPGLVEEITPGVLSVTEVQKVLQALLREKVSIRNLEAILEVLADAGRHQRDAPQLAELARQRLGQAICRSLSGDAGTLHVITLDPLVEAHIGQSLRAAAESGGRLAIEPRVADQLVGGLVQQAEGMMKANLLPVLLCSPDLRRHADAHRARAAASAGAVDVRDTRQHRSEGVLGGLGAIVAGRDRGRAHGPHHRKRRSPTWKS